MRGKQTLPAGECFNMLKVGSRTSLITLAILILCVNILFSSASQTKLPSEDIIELTSSNFDEVTAGKNVFIMFHVLWCGHCQTLIPKWNKLAAKYKDTPELLFAHVDCDGSGERDGLCKKYRIQGTPTLFYGEPGHNGSYLQRYTGDFEYASISTFAKEHLLEPICSPANLDACDETMRQRIVQWEQKTTSELSEDVKAVENELEQIDIESKEGYKVLQASYDKIQRNKVMNDARIKENIRILKEVIADKS